MNKSYRIPIITKKSQSDRMLKEIEWRRACGRYRAYKGTAVVIVVSYRRCVDAEEFFDCAG
jgi:hypothetical protein